MTNDRLQVHGMPDAQPETAAVQRPAAPAPGNDAGLRRTPAERKVVTVLFADIVESSSMVSGRDPEEADQTLLEILQILTDAVGRYGGTVAQVLGDGMMAVFGAPSALEDHPLRACLAAQDIARAAIESDAFKVRVGISSGEVVAQVVESGVWTDYRTVGETVHIAAKLQQRAEPNSVLLSRETRDLVPTGLSARPSGVLRLAAAAEPVEVFALESARAMRRTAMDLLSSDASLFVGRRAELAQLGAALRHAADGSGALVQVTGEAGIGKSRLTGELVRSPSARGFGVLHWPQFPIRRLGEPDDLEAVARSLAMLVAGDTGHDAAARIAAAAERGSGELGAEAVRELFGIPSTHTLWRGLDPAQKVEFSVEGLVAAVVDLATEQPLLILVEDAHWTHGLTNRLLDALVGAVEDARVLVLVTARPDNPGGWTAPEDARHLALEPLEAVQIDEFLDHWLGHHFSLAELKSRLAAQSQGVPLYLEESLRALESEGSIVGSPGQYEAADPDAKLVLPATVHGLLASRIDALPPAVRRTLLYAAVIGTSVDLGLLRQIAPVPSTDLPPILAQLEREGFFARSRLLPNMEVTFRHALVQEVAYATLTKRERQPLHGRVLRALRARPDRELPSRVELMAQHAFLAEDWAAACAYGRRAGQRSEGRCKHADAGRFYGNALKALDHLPDTRRHRQRRIDLLIAIPRILLPQGGRGAGGLLEQAIEHAHGIDDRFRYARASSLQASFQWVYGDLDSAVALSESALAALRGDEGPDVHVQLHLRLAGVLCELGRFKEAMTHLERSQTHVPPGDINNRFGLTLVAAAGILMNRSRCLAELGDGASAVAAAQLSVEIAEESAHAFSMACAHLYLGLAHTILQRFEQAIPPLKSALNIMEAIRLHVYQPLTLGALGYALVRTDKVEEGASFLTASRAHARMLRILRHEPQILLWIADAALRMGEADDAVINAGEAVRKAHQAGQMADAAWAGWVLARAHAARGEHHLASKALEDSETLAVTLSLGTLLRLCDQERSAAHTV